MPFFVSTLLHRFFLEGFIILYKCFTRVCVGYLYHLVYLTRQPRFYRYDREEGNAMSDADSSLVFFGDEASFQKKEAELAKRLVQSCLFIKVDLV